MTLDRKQRDIEVSAEQLASIRDAVRRFARSSNKKEIDEKETNEKETDEKETDEKGGVESMSVPAAFARSSHLSDAEFVTLCMEANTEQLEEEYRTHLAKCPECMGEWQRMQGLGAVWQDAAVTARLEIRLSALQKTASGSVSLTTLRLVSLAALLPAQAEWAAQSVPAPMSVNFPVCEAEHPVPDLTGALQRRNHEVYALITPLNEEATARYRERSVMLTITDEENGQPILTREIGVGVAVLLGTNLPLTATSVVQADLLTSS